jgi:hypothetical protein
MTTQDIDTNMVRMQLTPWRQEKDCRRPPDAAAYAAEWLDF